MTLKAFSNLNDSVIMKRGCLQHLADSIKKKERIGSAPFTCSVQRYLSNFSTSFIQSLLDS
ncbi:hypothetical protein QYF61_026655, partial [Mycteria americana]